MRFGLAVVLLTAACDIPTELPKWNPTFAVPLEGTSIPVAQLLPSSVQIRSGAFVLSPAPITFQAQLGAFCLPCRQLSSQIVPKPEFDAALIIPLPFPADVIEATVTGGWIHFSIRNGFSFDPVRPGGAQTGMLAIEIQTMNGAVRGSYTLSGVERGFPPATTITDSISISAGSATAGFQVRLHVHSPAGPPVRVDPQQSLQLTVTPRELAVSEARVLVENRQVTAQQLQLNLTGVDEFIIRRVRGGKLVLAIQNDLVVGGTFTLNITGGFAPVAKTITLTEGATTVEVTLTEPELESILGRSVVASISGIITSSAALVTPTSVFAIEPLLVLELGPGE